MPVVTMPPIIIPLVAMPLVTIPLVTMPFLQPQPGQVRAAPNYLICPPHVLHVAKCIGLVSPAPQQDQGNETCLQA